MEPSLALVLVDSCHALAACISAIWGWILFCDSADSSSLEMCSEALFFSSFLLSLLKCLRFLRDGNWEHVSYCDGISFQLRTIVRG